MAIIGPRESEMETDTSSIAFFLDGVVKGLTY